MQNVSCLEGKEVRGGFFPESEQHEPKQGEETGHGAFEELKEYS